MPFVLIVGLPSSGKTTRVKELQRFAEKEGSHTVVVLGDETESVDKNDVYADVRKEKDLRGTLKSVMQRKMNKEDVVILDSLNYIKGYRYELFCVIKSSQTPQCVIHCDINPELASEWNKERPPAEQYSQQNMDALVMRFEAPESKNRWDSPLFVVHPEDTLPCQDIMDALYKRKALPPNMSTLSQPISSTNFIHELDKMTQAALTVLMDAQKTAVPGDSVNIPGAKDKVLLHRHVTLAELQRVRRQYISFAKTHPVQDSSKIPNMFVQFINTTLNTG